MVYNHVRCSKRISPDSTFKIALSLMAFNDNIINKNTVFIWDGKNKGYPQWNKNQTPYTWLRDSVVWVSRLITPQLGIDRINKYLQNFHYGNEDFSGDPEKNNGLMSAWLDSSLKISANEQVLFLRKVLSGGFLLSKESICDTKKNMYIETSPHGWRLYGKTGTSAPLHNTQNGWFIGFIEKSNQIYLFSTNFSEIRESDIFKQTGGQAKNITKKILVELGLY